MYLYSAITGFTGRGIINTRKDHLLPPARRHARLARWHWWRLFSNICPGFVGTVECGGCCDRCDRAGGDRILTVTAVWPVARGGWLVSIVGVVALVSGSSRSGFACSSSSCSSRWFFVNTKRTVLLFSSSTTC